MNKVGDLRMNRRMLVKGAGATALAAAVASGRSTLDPAGVSANDNLANAMLPPDIGQTDIQVYIPETGHTLRGSMLDYWRATGGASVFGNPISEPFGTIDGYYSQAFERAVFQYRPEYLYTEDPIIRLMPIGYDALALRRGSMEPGGRRSGGGGDRQRQVWNPLDPDGDSAGRAIEQNGFYDEITGHTVFGAFADFYYGHEGQFYLGSPLSQPLTERGLTVQYFEGGLLTQDPDGNVALAPLAKELARHLGIETKRVKQDNLPTYDEALFQTAPNPYPASDLATPGRRWIEISLSQQQLWAYQGYTVVLGTYVSTGLDPNVTLPGLFHVRLKYPTQTMSGFTDGTGEVVALGDEAPADTPTATAYEVEDVPDVMYFSISAEALHGAYWHNNFGNPMSHGCVNLPVDVAAWMYGWAPLGTMVWIHD